MYTFIWREYLVRFREFEWDIVNIAHIARHRVGPDEVEAACSNSPLVLRGRHGRYYVLGRTDSGRYLMVVLERRGNAAHVITARDMTAAERRRFIRR
jgi:uncharacterized DUF497 family protein